MLSCKNRTEKDTVDSPSTSVKSYNAEKDPNTNRETKVESVHADIAFKSDEINKTDRLIWNGFNLMGDSAIIGLARWCTSYNYDRLGPKKFLVRREIPRDFLICLKKNAHLAHE